MGMVSLADEEGQSKAEARNFKDCPDAGLTQCHFGKPVDWDSAFGWRSGLPLR
jgi:hypothetical protein